MPILSDREFMVAIFNAVAGLAERLTGEKYIVRIEKEDGTIIGVYRDGGSVEWKKDVPRSHQLQTDGGNG